MADKIHAGTLDFDVTTNAEKANKELDHAARDRKTKIDVDINVKKNKLAEVNKQLEDIDKKQKELDKKKQKSFQDRNDLTQLTTERRRLETAQRMLTNEISDYEKSVKTQQIDSSQKIIESEKKNKKAIEETARAQEKLNDTIAKSAKDKTPKVKSDLEIELEKEKQQLKEIEQLQAKNDAARAALENKKLNYGQEVLGTDKVVYDSDKIRSATSALENFNSTLEKRNQFQEKYNQLCLIISDSFVGPYSVNNGIYKDLDDFTQRVPAMKQLSTLMEKGIKGTLTKEINQMFGSVTNELKSSLSMTRQLIGSGDVVSTSVNKKLDEEEVRLNQEMQSLYNQREEQLNKIANLNQKVLDLTIRQGQEEAKNVQNSKLTREELINKAKELRFLTRDEVSNKMESDPNFINDLRAMQSLYNEQLQPIKKIVSEISTLSSIKDMDFEKLEKSAVETAKALSKMYDEGINDTKEYIALQHKLIKTIDKIGTKYGGLRGSGANSKLQLKDWIYNSIENSQGYHIGRSSAIDAIYRQGAFSIYGDGGKLIPMRELAGELINYKGTGRISAIEDYDTLNRINALLKDADFVNREKEVKENAKAIKSYEELCSVIERYNELYKKDPIYGYDARPLKEAKKYKNNFKNDNEELEFIELISRLQKTGVDEYLSGYKSIFGNVPKDGLKKLAEDLGFIRKEAQLFETSTGQLSFVQDITEDSAKATASVKELNAEINKIDDGSEQLSLFDTMSKQAEEQVQAEKQVAQAVEQADQTKKKELETAKQLTAEAQKQAAAENAKKDKVPKLEDLAANTPVSVEEIVKRDIQNALGLLRSAKNNETVLFNLKGVVNGDDLINQARGMVNNIAKQANLALKSFSVTDNTVQVKMLNEELGVTVDQMYQLKAATEDTNSATLQLMGSKYNQTISNDDNAINKLNQQMKDASVSIDTMESKLGRLGNVKGVSEAANAIQTMRLEAEKFDQVKSLTDKQTAFDNFKNAEKSFNTYYKAAQEAQKTQKIQQAKIDSAWKDEFQNNYKYNNGKTGRDQTTLNSMSDYYKKQEADAQNFNNNMKAIYKDLMSTMTQINTLDTKINDLSLKDGGSGLYKKSIESLQTQKSALVADMRSITSEINNSLNIQPNENGIAKFFDVARERAALTSAEIEKFDALLVQADRIGYDFASKVTGKVQPTIEKLASLQKMVSNGTINNSDIVGGIDAMSSTLSSKFEKFKKYQDGSSAMGAMNYADSISKNIAALDKLAQKEAQYFANKRKYTSGKDGMSNFNAKSMDAELNSMQSKLSKAAQEFAKGQAIITGFKQSADGISTLDFSVFDRGTNSLRQFSMEMGSMSNNMYVTENTINRSAKSMQTATQQISKMSSLLKTVELSGFDIAPETAHSSVTRLLTLMQELNAAMQKGDPESIDKISKEAKIATSEVEKLLNESIKLQNAMGDKTAKNLGDYIDDGKVTAYDQLSSAVRKHAADVDGATLSVGKFNEKQNTLAYTLTRGNGNVEHYTASINKLGKTINTQQTGITKLKTGWQDFSSIILKSSKQMMMAFAGYNIFTQAIQAIRQGLTYIKDIDSAMTELKKVTDETNASYARFLNTASKDASKIGSTTSDYVNATAGFARLGYSMSEAGDMAQSALVYKNVGDGLDSVDEATNSIISTMKAFGVQSSDTMSIVDKFNEVGVIFADYKVA